MDQAEIAYFNEALVELGIEYDHERDNTLWVRILEPATMTEGDRDRVAVAVLQWLPTSKIAGRFTSVGIEPEA